MAYDQSKDKTIKSWKHEGGLWVSVTRYNGGEPKVQIGPREFAQGNGTPGYGKAGRLNVDEVRWLHSLHEEIMTTMDEAPAK